MYMCVFLYVPYLILLQLNQNHLHLPDCFHPFGQGQIWVGGPPFCVTVQRSPHFPARPELFQLRRCEERVAVAYRGEGGLGVQTPPEILKALQNCAKFNPTVKTVKNC